MRNDTKNLTRAAPDVRKCAGLPVPRAENGNHDNSRYHVPFEMLMKTLRLYSRLLATLLCAIGLAACGGSTTTITIGGAINGLTTSGLTLSNGVNTVVPAANATSYAFSGSVNQGSTYTIAVLAEPTGLTCTFAGKLNAITAVAGGENVTNADLTCVQSAFNLGGTVTRLTTDGLVLADGNSTVAITRQCHDVHVRTRQDRHRLCVWHHGAEPAGGPDLQRCQRDRNRGHNRRECVGKLCLTN